MRTGAGEAGSLKLEGAEISYSVRRSAKRRKTVSIMIHPDDGVIVRAPKKAPAGRIADFVQQKAAWIHRRVQEVERAKLPPLSFTTGEPLMLLGGDYPLVVKDSPSGDRRVRVAFAGGCIVVGIPEATAGPERADAVKKALAAWYSARAEGVLAGIVDRFVAATGLKPEAVSVKNLKASWGICNGNNLSFNWRLIMAPLPLVDYVVVHELWHLRHKNHSPVFWAAVGSVIPDYKARRKELGRLGSCLRRI